MHRLPYLVHYSLPSFNIFSLSLFTFVKQLIYFENNNNTFKCSVPFFTSSTRTGFNTIWGVRKLSLNSTSKSKSARACSSSSASRGRSSYRGWKCGFVPRQSISFTRSGPCPHVLCPENQKEGLERQKYPHIYQFITAAI